MLLHRYGDFLFYKDGSRPPSWIFTILNFNGRTAQEDHIASPCQISSKRVKQLPRYCDFSIFQNGGRRDFGFLKF